MIALALAVLALMLASCAVFGQTAMFGQTGCTLTPVADQPHVAEITYANVLEGGEPISEGVMTAGGLTVWLVIHHAPGDVPDLFSFAAPDGYQVIPPDLELPEGRQAVALVYEWVGS